MPHDRTSPLALAAPWPLPASCLPPTRVFVSTVTLSDSLACLTASPTAPRDCGVWPFGRRWLANNLLNGALPTELGKLAAAGELYVARPRTPWLVPLPGAFLYSIRPPRLRAPLARCATHSRVARDHHARARGLNGNQLNRAIPTEIGALAAAHYLCAARPHVSASASALPLPPLPARGL